MQVLSVNVAPLQEIEVEGQRIKTDVFKEPVNGRVLLHQRHLEGDAVIEVDSPDLYYQAVSVYPVAHYDYWAQQLGRDSFPHGYFGENLTVAGMMESHIHIGDIFQVGFARLQVTQPRIPGPVLGVKLGDARFPRRMLQNGRTGFYMRVLEEGTIAAGDPIGCIYTDVERMTVTDMRRLLYFDPDDLAGAEKALRIEALAPEWRQFLATRLAKVGGQT